MASLTTLGEAMLQAQDQPWDSKLYLPPNEVWGLTTRCAILVNLLECDDDDDEPRFARTNGLTYALGMSDVQDIVSNAQQQVAVATPEQLLAAFLFYYDRDAFIVFETE